MTRIIKVSNFINPCLVLVSCVISVKVNAETNTVDKRIANVESAHSELHRAKVSLDKIVVKNEAELYAAVSQANANSRTAIVIRRGTYLLHSTLNVTGDYITIRSADNAPSSVVLKGPGMIKMPRVFNLIRVSGKYFMLSGLTAEGSPNHIIQIAGESDADFITIQNCRLQNAREQIVKVSSNAQQNISSDLGRIEDCVFAYTAGIGPQYYIGGIDMHGGKQWLIRNNQFFGIASPEKRVAEHAIHLWNASANNVVANNLIINSDRGIGFGLQGLKNEAGVIMNNMIVHADLTHPSADVGIVLEESPNTIVKNNKVVLLHSYPNAIEYRFASTKDVKIVANQVNKKIRSRNRGHAVLSENSAIENDQTLINKSAEKLPADLFEVFKARRK